MYALLNKTWTLLANAKAVSKIKQNQNHATIYSACAFQGDILSCIKAVMKTEIRTIKIVNKFLQAITKMF